MGGFFQPANSQQVVGYLTIFRVLSKARIIIFCGNETTHYQSGKIKKNHKGKKLQRKAVKMINAMEQIDTNSK